LTVLAFTTSDASLTFGVQPFTYHLQHHLI